MEENPNEKKSGGVLKVFIAIVLIALSIFALVKLIDCATQNNGQSPTNTDGTTQLLSRSARRSDIRVENETTISLTNWVEKQTLHCVSYLVFYIAIAIIVIGWFW